jgi:hypothetical protein
MNIPTAEDLLANNIDGLRDFIDDDDIFCFYKGVICEFAKEFAAMHVEAALNEAADNSDIKAVDADMYGVIWEVELDSILNAYPFENIK